jgi:5'-nucleotidase
MTRNRIIAFVVGALVVIAAIVGIVLATSSDDSSDTEATDATTTTVAETTTSAPETTTTTAQETTTTSEAPPAEPLKILVTNDDGVGSAGIAALSDALAALPDVEVTVVAPLGNQSGVGDTVNGGPYEPIETETASGMAATAIDGTPADNVLYALNDAGLEPHVVVSGSNDGNNLGPFTQVSGTVGAARTAARNGVPGLAVSNSLGEPPQFENSVGEATKWIEQHRAELLARELDPILVFKIDGPTCESGEVKGTLELPIAIDFGDRLALPGPIDCALDPPADPVDDVDAVNAGYIVISTFDPELSLFG